MKTQKKKNDLYTWEKWNFVLNFIVYKITFNLVDDQQNWKAVMSKEISDVDLTYIKLLGI